MTKKRHSFDDGDTTFKSIARKNKHARATFPHVGRGMSWNFFFFTVTSLRMVDSVQILERVSSAQKVSIFPPE